MVDAMHDGKSSSSQKKQQHQQPSKSLPLLNSSSDKDQHWILNSSALLDSQGPPANQASNYDAQAYESNGQKETVKPFDRVHAYQDTAKFGGDKRHISFTQNMYDEDDYMIFEE